jgi:hypothetical protein
VPVTPTWALLAYLSGDAGWRSGSLHAEAAYDGAARVFPLVYPQSTLVQAARIRFAWDALSWLSVGALGRGKDRRGGFRDYSDAAAGAWVTLRPAPRTDLTLESVAHRFVYWPAQSYSFGAPELALNLRYGITFRHWLMAWGEIGWRRYNSFERLSQDFVSPDLRRHDLVVTGGAGYRFRGPFTLGLDYSYTAQLSNSYGETLFRHRVAASFGVALPWAIYFLGQGALQFTSFPSGVYLSPDLLLADDEENLNSLSLKVSRALNPWLEVELRYALYQGTLPANHLSYLRHTASLGATFRWPPP